MLACCPIFTDLDNVKIRLNVSEAILAEDGIILTEAQIQAHEIKSMMTDLWFNRIGASNT